MNLWPDFACAVFGHDFENIMLIEQRDAYVICGRCGLSFDSPEPIDGYPMRHWNGYPIPTIEAWNYDLDHDPTYEGAETEVTRIFADRYANHD